MHETLYVNVFNECTIKTPLNNNNNNNNNNNIQRKSDGRKKFKCCEISVESLTDTISLGGPPTHTNTVHTRNTSKMCVLTQQTRVHTKNFKCCEMSVESL